MPDWIVRPLHPIFAAELIGADLTREPTPELVRAVEDAMDTYGILVVRDAEITDAQHIRFSRAFGPLEIPSRPRSMASPRMAPELFAAGNLDKDGNIMPYATTAQHLMRGAERFHTDSSFHTMPTKWSLLLGVETPPPSAGGDTLFADMRAAYDDLSDAMKARIENLIGLHDFLDRAEARRADARDHPGRPQDHSVSHRRAPDRAHHAVRAQGDLCRRPLLRHQGHGRGQR